jgi:hypothetical protein
LRNGNAIVVDHCTLELRWHGGTAADEVGDVMNPRLAPPTRDFVDSAPAKDRRIQKKREQKRAVADDPGPFRAHPHRV